MLSLLHVLQILLLVGSTAQRPTVQKGHLYQAEGSQSMIWCHGQDLHKPPRLTFDWSMYLPFDPDQKIHITSKGHKIFQRSIYKQHEDSRTFYMEDHMHNLAVLIINSIQAQNSGKYGDQEAFTNDNSVDLQSAKTKVIGSTAQRPTVQKGHIYQAEGSQIMIWCYAQDFHEPPRPTFSSTVYLPFDPDQKIHITSTGHKIFQHSSYRQHVDDGALYVDDHMHNLAVLTTNTIQTQDSGEYGGQATFTNEDSLGHQSAKTKMTVVPDTFQVVTTSMQFNKTQGDSLELKCEVSSRTAQDDQLLNVSWWHRQQGAEGYRVILVLSKGNILSPGPDYAQRFKAGNIQLVKEGDTTYNLTLHNLQPSDQGEYLCEAVKRTVDANGALQVKRSGGMIVNVRPKGSMPQKLTMQKGPFYRNEGTQIMIWCYAQDFHEPGVELNFTWSVYLFSAPDQKIQIISTADELFPHTSYRERVHSGEVFVERPLPNLSVLTILGTRARDTGEYECQAHFANNDSLNFHSAKTKVTVVPDTLKVATSPVTFDKIQGDSLELTCEVSSRTAHLVELFNVSWVHRQQGAEAYRVILVLPKDGRLFSGPAYAKRFQAGNITLSQVGNTTYKLMLQNLQPSDQGEYFCVAIEWTVDPDGALYYLSGRWSGGLLVNVQPKGVSAENSMKNSNFTLMCEPPLPNVTIVLVMMGYCQTPKVVVFKESSTNLTKPVQDSFILEQSHGFTVRSADCSDADDYCCVFNAVEHGKHGRIIFLEVPAAIMTYWCNIRRMKKEENTWGKRQVEARRKKNKRLLGIYF